MDMCSNAFVKHLAKSIAEGKVSEEDVNIACRRILEAKYKLGLFSDPYRYCNTKRSKSEIYTAENRQAARDVAAETFVLLKNEGNILPLKKEGKIALIGPLADTRNNIAGTWSVAQEPSKYTTIKEAMEHALAGKPPYYMPREAISGAIRNCSKTANAASQSTGATRLR